MTLDEIDDEASLDTALSVASAFGVKRSEATRSAGDVGAAVAGWRDTAERHGLTPAQIERMASAFDHADLAQACAAATGHTRQQH